MLKLTFNYECKGKRKVYDTIFIDGVAYLPDHMVKRAELITKFYNVSVEVEDGEVAVDDSLDPELYGNEEGYQAPKTEEEEEVE